METMDNTETWTADDSRALDAYAKRQPNRVPLQRDERLWELLADDRRHVVTELPRCTKCDRPMRPFATSPYLYPETVARGSRGMCITHYKHFRDAAAS